VATEPSITSLYAKVVSRKRERLTLATEYTHVNLATYLSNEVLSAGWDVHTPSEGATGISQFPVAHVNRTTHAKELLHLANFLCGIPVSEAEDQYNGHCETCAVYFTNEVVKLVDSEVKLQPSVVLNEAYVLVNKRLADLSWEDCVAEIFDAERTVREEMKHDQTTHKGRTAVMWEHLSTQDTFKSVGNVCVSGEDASVGEDASDVSTTRITQEAIDFTAGSPGLPSRIRSCCRAVVTSGCTMIVPLYVLTCACVHPPYFSNKLSYQCRLFVLLPFLYVLALPLPHTLCRYFRQQR
jgi:hypothetical protein